MINNRQAGRRRGRGGGNNNGQRQGGGQPGNGSRIDSRARGNANQLYEKYKNMAADAQRAGDRVNTEYYLQFADHYFRVLSEQRGRFEDQPQPRRDRDGFDYDGDDEFGDEGEPIRGNEQADGARFDERGPRDDRPRDDRPRDDRPYRDGNGDGRPRAERDGNRDANRDPNRDGGRDFRRDRDGNRDGERDAAPRREWRDRRPEQAPVEVAGQRRAEPMLPGESLEARAEEVLDADRPLDAPVESGARRRGRPRRDAAELNGAGEGLGIDRLPPSLTLAANDEAPVDAKPRRRRARPVEDETPDAAE